MARYVDLKTIREELNVYELENGQILKTKQIIVDISFDSDKRGEFGNIGFKHVSHVRPGNKIDISKFEPEPNRAVTDDDIVTMAKFKIIYESVNVYETKDLIILADDRVERIGITKFIDKDNIPILRYRTDLGISAIPKRTENQKRLESTDRQE